MDLDTILTINKSFNQFCCIVTPVSVEGSIPTPKHGRMLVDINGRVSGTIGGGAQPILQSFELSTGHSTSLGMICGGRATILIEPAIPDKPNLLRETFDLFEKIEKQIDILNKESERSDIDLDGGMGIKPIHVDVCRFTVLLQERDELIGTNQQSTVNVINTIGQLSTKMEDYEKDKVQQVGQLEQQIAEILQTQIHEDLYGNIPIQDFLTTLQSSTETDDEIKQEKQPQQNLTLTDHLTQCINICKSAKCPSHCDSITPFSPDKPMIPPLPFIFMNSVRSLPRLLIFGGGHCGYALCEVASTSGFLCHVFDDREEFAQKERFPKALSTRAINFARDIPTLYIDKETYIVAMTRGHSFDFDVVAACIPRKPKYIGMIGSKTKCLKTFNRLRVEKGFSDIEIGRVFAPVGLAIGGSSPGEIAVSIVAQMLMMKYVKSGQIYEESNENIHPLRSHPLSLCIPVHPTVQK